MKPIGEFLSYLRNNKVKIWLEQDKLRYKLPKGDSKLIIAQMKERKDELLEFLQKASQASTISTIEPINRDGNLPLSFVQQRMWFFCELENQTAYNMSTVLKIKGDFSTNIFEKALVEIVKRHEVLRTTFPIRNDSPCAVVSFSDDVHIHTEDFSHAENFSSGKILDKIKEITTQHINLKTGPLFQVTILQVKNNAHIVVFHTHHVISDYWSMGILIHELHVFYRCFLQQQTPDIPDLPIQYIDFAHWQRETFSAKQKNLLDYWKQQLQKPLPTLELVSEKQRSDAMSFAGDNSKCSLPKELVSQVKNFANDNGVTVFMLMLTVFKVLLYRCSGQQDIIVGTPIDGRNHSETEGLIGCFLNLVAIRTQWSQTPSFAELLLQVQKTTLGAYAHQEIPFEKIVAEIQPERKRNRHLIFDVLFDFFNTSQDKIELADLDVELWNDFLEPQAKFSLTLYVEDRGDEILLDLLYQRDLHSKKDMDLFVERYVCLLKQVLEHNKPIDSYEIPTLKSDTLDLSTLVPETSYEPITQTFCDVVTSMPDTIAVTHLQQKWNYQQLGDTAHTIASALIQKGFSKQRIILVGETSFGLIAGLMGVFVSGNVLVTLDKKLPQARMELVAKECAAAGIVYVGDSLPQQILNSLPIIQVLPQTGNVVGLQIDKQNLPSISPKDPAYVFFTSGTTGIPKGVLGQHSGLAHFITWQRNTFNVVPEDKVAQVTGLSFDVVLREILLPLTSGATLCLINEEDKLNGAKMFSWFEEHQITLLHTVPSLAKTWLASTQAENVIPSLRVCFFAGEPLTSDLIHKWKSFFTKTTIVNLYGPSETTLAKCYYIIPETVESGIQPIGQPLPETQIIIMSPDNKVCAPDEPGEIVIRTPFRTQGYINGPTDKFVVNPHTNNANDLLYYTGDGGVYRQSGFIDILGRLDRQVKINGIRIEPAEISSVLEQHPKVKECVVIAKENDRGDKQLYAYLVCSEHLDLSMEWHDFLVQQLPEHMIPSVFIPIETIPLTPNGKVDYKALNMIEAKPEVVEQYATHLSSPTEEMLTAIWCDLLGKNHIDKEKSFFELGGHSLLAAQAVFRINNALATELPMHAIFEYPTIACLTTYAESLSNESQQIPPIEAIPRSDKLPLSFAQERIWFLDQLDEGLAYNMLATVMLEGTLNFDALRFSISQIIARHEAIRTNFVVVENRPVQIISEKFDLEIPTVNLQELSAKDQQIAIEELTAKEAKKPFDLAKDLLVRFTCISLSDNKNIILFTMHHIISDGWSVGVFIHEMNHFYKCFLQNAISALPTLPVQYADFTMWQKKLLAGEILTTQLQYWKNKLDGAPLFLELPTDYPRPPVQSSRGNTIYFNLDQDTSESIVKLSHHFDATPYMSLLSTFSILLSLYSNQEDIIIGSPIANRDQLEWQNLIGLFVNTLALRIDLTREPNFEELLQRVRDTSLEAYRNQNVPFEKLVEELQPQRNLSHSPIFQVMFVLQSEHEELRLPQLTMSSIPVKNYTSKFDLYLSIEKTRDGFKGRFEYNTDLFTEATILRFIETYKKLLTTIIANPQMKITRLLSDFEREKRTLWNNTEMDYPQKSLHRLFEHQVNLTPEKIALVFENKELTYHELNSQANQLAHYLIANGVKRGTTIGICMKRSLEMIVALLAVQKTGCAYLPLDPLYPEKRLSFILQDSETKFVITEENLSKNIAGITYIYYNQINTDTANTTNLNFDCANDLLYLIYTSGSTGNPKGVMVTHQNVVNFLTTIAQKIDLKSAETFLAVTTISFDIAGLEIYLPLIYGHKLVVLSEEDAHDGMRLRKKISETSATIMQATPATWQMLLDCDWEGSTSLKALCGGEELSSHLATSLLNKTKNLWNLYGPTETTIWSTILPVEIGENVSIGHPLGNTKTYILNRYLESALIGSIGELYIGGDGVANGYWQRPGLTAQKFVPSLEVNGERLYRTGDLARYLPDGNIQFLGRKDYQVKFHGFRIELGEIESALREYPHINQAVVIVDQSGAAKRLVAYIVSEKQEFEQAPCDSFLRTKLPLYMIPHMYIKMDSMPLTPNLKVNRALLPKPGKIEALHHFTPAETAEQRALVEIWQEVLEIDKIGIHDDFFALGGHSLLATQIISRIRQNCGCEVSVKTFFATPTIAELAQYLLANENITTKSPITRYPRDNNLYPLSFAQERLWFLEQLAPGNPFYNMFSAVKIKGPLQINIVEKSLNKILQRHEALRTNFKSKDGHVYQVITAQKSINLSVIDLQNYSAQEQQKECEKLCSQEAAQPFSLENDLLLRGCLLQLDAETHILLITMHHIVSDRWSIDVFIKEIVTLYKNYSQQQEPSLPDLPVQYVDYTYWQRQWLSGENLQKQWNYWKANLKGANFVLDLPGDKSRPNIHTFRGADEKFQLDSELLQKLKALSQESKVSLFMTLSSVFSILISRYTQQDDIVIGSPISNRTHRDIEPLIGFFVNTIVLRMDMSQNPSFADFLRKVQKTTLDAYDHQDLPFEKLVQELEPTRDMGRNPLVQVSFVLQNTPPVDIELDQLTINEIELERTSSRFDLEVHLWESKEGIEGFFLYYKDLFNSVTIKKMIECFKYLLQQVVTLPHKKLSEYSISPTAKLHRESKVVPVKEEFVFRLFENQVMAIPDAPALMFASSQMTYQEVNSKANCLAHYLRSKGVKEEDRVTILIERSFDLIIAILAVQKVGGTYIPLNINDPQQRILFILEDAQSKILLTQTKFAKNFASDIELFCIDDIPKINFENGNIATSLKMKQLAYIIYTSGSTGTPKGVMISHRALFNYLNWCIPQYKIREEGQIVPLHSSISFDATITALFPPLVTGKSVWIVPEKEEIETLAQILREEPNLGLVKITPSHLEALKEFTFGHNLHNFRFIVGGEALTKNHLSAFKNERISIINEYGPTETTVGCSTYQVDWDNLVDNIPIGCAIHGMEMYILDKNLQLVPTGVRGEIYIAGIGLARGYLNNPSLSAAKFIPHPFSELGERMYKTGDIARYLPDGNIEYCGRTDSQIKIRGFRMELGEIQNAIMDFTAIKQSVVTVSKNADKKLTAYIVVGEENLVKESNAALEWQPVFDNSYLESSTESLNFLGWTNSYNRLAIPQQEMEEWLDNTAERILSHKPQKLLEIGCGTGLIIAKVAAQCHEYFATDFSAEALRHAQQIKYSMGLSNVNFKLQPAHVAKDIPQNYFDTVVINSVVQYFPNATYLQNVIENALKCIKEKGTIFIGDVRNLASLRYFYISLEAYESGKSISCSELDKNILQRSKKEPELVIHPLFFVRLKEKFKEINHVEILIKKGKNLNELNRFRYDVILHINSNEETLLSVSCNSWQDNQLTIPKIKEILANETPQSLCITQIPNAHIYEESFISKQLNQDNMNSSLEEIMAHAPQNMSIDPQIFWALQSELPYTISVSLSLVNPDFYNVIFKRSDMEDHIVIPEKVVDENITLTNIPLQIAKHKKTIEALENHLQQKLPQYMIPQDFLAVEKIPLTSNGKVDYKALECLTTDNTISQQYYFPPRNQIESNLAVIWQEILGLESVGIQDNFFDLGGHSLLAVQLMARIQQRFAKQIPLTSLFSATTVEKQAQLIQHQQSYSSSPLVAIQPQGKNKPLFCIPGAGGNVLYFYPLSRYLGKEQPLYGLQAVGSDGEQSAHSSVQEMAECYVREIKNIDNSGIYYLAGHSFGARVAFEVAQQLIKEGSQVALVAALDASAPSPQDQPLGMDWDETKWMEMIAKSVEDLLKIKLDVRYDHLKSLAANEQLTYLHNKLIDAKWFPPQTDIKRLKGLIEVYRSNAQTIYLPQSFSPVHIELFATQSLCAQHKDDSSCGWNKYASNSVCYHEIAGDHLTMMTEPCVKVLAQKLKVLLDPH